MERITWHFPKPLNEQKILNKQEEQKLFYRLAEDFSAILNREVIINNNYPIRFEDEHTSIYYRAEGFVLTILIKRDWLFYTDFEHEQRYLKIAYFMVEPKNTGIGSKIIKHFIKELTATSLVYVTLDTRDNDGRRFWRRLGFQPPYNSNTKLDWYLMLPK